MNPVQKTIRGRGSLKNLPLMMEKLNIHRPMIVVSRSLSEKLVEDVPALLGCPVFSGYHANPDLADSASAAAIYLQENCDGLISVGGGSAIDTAKAVKARLKSENEDDLKHNRLDGSETCPQIAVPGTAGTGSEATQFAVVYVEGQKLSLDHPSLQPEGVILDPSLLDSLTAYHKKSCALDSLCQGIESYWSRKSNDDSRIHAYLAIVGILDNLKKYLSGDPHAADEMMDASYQSGKAIQLTRTTAAHAMSYCLTKTMGIAHGHACMLTLPFVWEHMLSSGEKDDLLRDLSSKMRLGDPVMGPKLLRGILFDLEMEIPPVPDEQTLDLLTESVNTDRLSNHPVPLSQAQIRQIYRKAMTLPSENEKQACLDIWRYYGRG